MGLLDKTATLTAGQDPGDTSTSGIGSLLSNSNLYNKAVTEGTINPNNVSLQDFDSFVVRNPDLVDPGIDVSGLRTTTDTSPYLLGNIPDYAGIQYEAYNPNRLSDLMRLYSGGFPMLDTDTAQIPGAIDTLVDAGGGGGGMDQATGGLDTTQPFQDLVDPNVNIDEVALTGGLTDAPAGGADMGTVPTDADVTFQNMGDADVGVELLDPTQYVGNLDDYDDLDDYNAALANAQGLTGPTVLDEPEVSQTLQDQGPTTVDFSTGEMLDANAQDIGNIYDEVTLTGDPGFQNYTASVDQIEDPTLRDKLSSSLTSATEGLSNAADLTGEKLKEIGTSIAASIGGIFKPEGSTITVPGLGEINVKETIGGMIINKVLGGPVTLFFSAAKAIAGLLPEESLENSTTRSIAAQLTAENDYGYNMQSGNIGQDPFGRNPVSQFGNYEQTLAEDATYVGDSKFSNAKKDYAQDYFNAKAEVAGGVAVTTGVSKEAGGTGITETGTVLGPGEFLPEDEDLVSLEDQLKSQPVTVEEISPGYSPDDDDPADDGPAPSSPSAPSNPYSGGEGGVQSGMDTPSAPEDDFSDFDVGDTSVAAEVTGNPIGGFFDAVDEAAGGGGAPSGGLTDAQAEANQDAGRGGNTGSTSMSNAQAAANQDAGRGGSGGGGGGGGKIVCTMMNDSYGFGSFRNKIWLKHSRDMKPEYQIGYHKIFLPLVKLSKTNKVLKKILEHIAIHRTIDIRQESRNKIHLLGRVYRKILEPICYLVGKYAK